MRLATQLAPTAIIVAALTFQPLMTIDAQGRPQVSGLEAAVSSDHPLASAAGADVLRRGGNAIDAAITMAGILTVTRPHMNGPGGDVFMLYYDAKTKQVYALNGTGRAGAKATPAFFATRNLKEVPSTGILSVSVPGAVQAWADALQKFGTIPLAKALEPAIKYAENGFPMTPRLAADLKEASTARKIAADPELSRTFMPGGAVPEVGMTLRQTDLAKSLRLIAAQGPAAIYKGDLAKKIIGFVEAEGGLLTADDLSKHTSTWTQPIETTYHGLRVLAFPPSSQGATTLELLNIAEQFDLKAMGHNSVEYINTLTRASQLAYRDRDAFIADPTFGPVPLDRLLSKEYARQLADQIRAGPALPDGFSNREGNGDTIYLCVVDKDGNAVSYIQSLFAAFGSGKMVPGTGITLHNRGALYVLDPKHPQVIAPGKRPFHTLAPSMVLHSDGSPFMVLGSPGGDGQPQTNVQVLNNIVLFGMNPQAAIEAQRLQANGLRADVEIGMFSDGGASLRAKGLTVREQQPSAAFGGASAIMIHPVSKARMVGSDFRREAFGIAW
jgi:gamma-glutamyltranspeptidase/glutathione hydrolase